MVSSDVDMRMCPHVSAFVISRTGYALYNSNGNIRGLRVLVVKSPRKLCIS